MKIGNPEQEFNDLRWGITMPITLMVGSNLVRLRARGSCSLTVVDVQRLKKPVPDPENWTTILHSLLVNTMTEVLGGLSIDASDVVQLTTVTERTTQAFRDNLETKVNAYGLQIKTLNIEAIESI